MGLVRNQVHVAPDGTSSTTWQVERTAARVCVWEHAVAPTTTSARLRAAEWLALASTVHSPVSDADVQAEVASAAGVDQQGT